MRYKELIRVIRAVKNHDSKVNDINISDYVNHIYGYYPARKLNGFFRKSTGCRISRCNYCSKRTPYYDIIGEHGNCSICEAQFADCSGCGGRVHTGSMHQWSGEGVYRFCRHCYYDLPRACSGCGVLFGSQGDTEGEQCFDCNPSNYILSYSTNALTKCGVNSWEDYLVSPYERGRESSLYMGFELEVQSRAYRSISETLDGRAILKSDSSISGRGFELVTLPATLQYHQLQWGDPFWKAIRAGASGNHDSCGMHVHCSKDALTILQIDKAGAFLNSPMHSALIKRIAGRSHNTYARWHHHALNASANRIRRIGAKSVSRTIKDEGYISSAHYYTREGAEKYQLMNTTPRHTVELRLFASTTAKAGILKNLEFADSLFSWVKFESLQQLTGQRFVEYVLDNRGIYPHLAGVLRPRSNQPEGLELCA